MPLGKVCEVCEHVNSSVAGVCQWCETSLQHAAVIRTPRTKRRGPRLLKLLTILSIGVLGVLVVKLAPSLWYKRSPGDRPGAPSGAAIDANGHGERSQISALPSGTCVNQLPYATSLNPRSPHLVPCSDQTARIKVVQQESFQQSTKDCQSFAELFLQTSSAQGVCLQVFPKVGDCVTAYTTPADGRVSAYLAIPWRYGEHPPSTVTLSVPPGTTGATLRVTQVGSATCSDLSYGNGQLCAVRL